MPAPSIIRRGTARISAMVMSAVSSVRTFGVLVTVIPRACAAVTSMLSTPLPKLAIILSLQSGSLITSSVISSVTVGTRISAERAASTICSGVIGVSSRLSLASNSSRMRVSIESGNLRVTTTRGFFLTDMSCSHEAVQTSLTRVFDTAVAARSRRFLGFPLLPFQDSPEASGRLGCWRSVLSSRRPGQDKNSGKSRPLRRPGMTGAGDMGIRRGFRSSARRFQELRRARRGDLLMALGRFCAVAVLVSGWLAASVSTGHTAKDTPVTASGLPIPRYVSLKSDHVNVRAGPTKDNDVAWVYTRSGLPVEITAEFENWRRVRDSEGAEGWVYHSLLSGRRTAVVTMKNKDDLAPLYDNADSSSGIAARLQAGVVAQVKKCDAHWCHIAGDGFDGWIEQQRLWGVYADEHVN